MDLPPRFYRDDHYESQRIESTTADESTGRNLMSNVSSAIYKRFMAALPPPIELISKD